MNRYDGMFILDVQGKDEGLKEVMDQIEKEIPLSEAACMAPRRWIGRKFERVSDKMESGFYVNISFELSPDKLQNLQAKLKLNEVVFRQFYLKKTAELQTA